MKIFYYFGHPAQFHFQKKSIQILKDKGYQIFIFIKTKDVLQQLVEENGLTYKNVLPSGRKSSFLGILWGLFKRNILLGLEIIKHKPDLLIASDPSFSQLGFLFRLPCINCIDDDIDAIGYYSILTYPFTKTIVTPTSCRVGKYAFKRIAYSGYMKLAYLHPKQFYPDLSKIGRLANNPFYIIRLADLNAHHDIGIEGINDVELREIISILSLSGEVYISSESILPAEFSKYHLVISPSDIHHYLFFAKLLICDSQSMAGEAAMLGTPSIRVSTFVGRLSVLEELEDRYQLTFGIKPGNKKALYDKINQLLAIPNLKDEFQLRRQKMLKEKIDVTAFMVWFVEKYPESFQTMKLHPDFQYNFL
jgi:uncharacterized protein